MELISIIIATINRSQNLKKCVKSILANSYSKFEIIIVDQSTSKMNSPDCLYQNKITYVKSDKKGKAHALNLGKRYTHGTIIAFTDDDCIVDRSWLKNINSTFINHPEITGLTGRTFPYQPEKHLNEICPCTFGNKTAKVIDKPCAHWNNIGFGNNMAFRKDTLEEVGGFRTWLGPGSVGSNAEDADIMFRVLLKGYKLMYRPEVVVYHNKWLNKDENRKQNLSYICGEVACYGYYAFHSHPLGKSVLLDNFKDSFRKIRAVFSSLIRFRMQSLKEIIFILEELIYRIRGLFIALYYSICDPLPS